MNGFNEHWPASRLRKFDEREETIVLWEKTWRRPPTFLYRVNAYPFEVRSESQDAHHGLRHYSK